MPTTATGTPRLRGQMAVRLPKNRSGNWDVVRVADGALSGSLSETVGNMRNVAVWTPASVSENVKVPAVWCLHGALGSLSGWANRRGPGGLGSISSSVASSIEAGALPPARLVFPDGGTNHGVCQWVDGPSHASGRWGQWIADAQTAMAAQFPTTRHVVTGHSSGGFGAVWLACDPNSPANFDGCAVLAPDAGFDKIFPRPARMAANIVASRGGLEGFWNSIGTRGVWRTPDALSVLILGCATHFDPDGEMVSPIGRNGQEVRRRWARWRQWDPVVAFTDKRLDATLVQTLWIGVGRRDEFQLVGGAKAMAEAARHAGGNVCGSLSDDTHSSLTRRWPYAIGKALGC